MSLQRKPRHTSRSRRRVSQKLAKLTTRAACELGGEIIRAVSVWESWRRKVLVVTFVVVLVLDVEALSIHKRVTAEKLFGRQLRTRLPANPDSLEISSTQQGSLSF